MNWHSDVLLYEIPQYQCVYTLSNDSDSTTDYIYHWNIKHKVWTKPNSLMIVRVDGYFHGVNPVNKGKREIVKLIYTPTDKINQRNIYNMAPAAISACPGQSSIRDSILCTFPVVFHLSRSTTYAYP